MSERLARPSPEAAAPRVGVPLQTRGAVQPGALYVARRVDEALVAALRAGRWSVVLGPRFSGKSSLRGRTVQTLQRAAPAAAEDAPAITYRCATIEARSLPAASSGAVYLALCAAVAAELRLPPVTGVTGFWQRYREEPPVQRFRRYLLQEVVTAEARTIILCDDFEALQTLPLALPELLAALGQVQEVLAKGGNAGLLTLVFFSSVLPEHLTAPAGRALWAAQRFLLADFTRAELSAFGPALAALVRDAEPACVDSWLDAVFAWTAGHPQLTQRLCQQLVARAPSPAAAGVASDPVGEPAQRVERLVQTLFLAENDANDTIAQDPCLREIAQALTRSPQASALIALYRRLLSGVPVTPDPLDTLQQELRLCGLAAEADDSAGTPRLRPRGRLVTAVLGESWAREHEVRLILQEAIARESAQADRSPPALTIPPTVALLRGVPLKNAQAWARKHPEALRPPEVRVLLASLEAARSEAEAKHQASAAALQRERRDKTEVRNLSGSATPAHSPDGYPRAPRRWGWVAAIGLALCLMAALASAHRRASRFEHAARAAATRAGQAEQALRTLQSMQPAVSSAPQPSASTPPEHAASAAPKHAPSAVPQHSLAAIPEHAAGASAKQASTPPRTVAPRRVPAPPRPLADRPKLTAQGKHATRELGYCPDSARPID